MVRACVFIVLVLISTFGIELYICLHSDADNCGRICARMGA